MVNDTNMPTRAVLVAVHQKNESVDECERSLKELERLLETAGGIAFAQLLQSKDSIDPRTFIGRGKIEELAEICRANDIQLVVFDHELSPSQIKNIEDALEGPDVIDRSMLILDIFAKHATTGEGKLQVELAQLKYTAPRLIGKGLQLSRQEGRIGTRGPGESKLESDRRHLARRIRVLESELEELDKNRSVMRAARGRSGIPKAAIVGYTNAGKSTLLNRLTDAGILAEDKLFATLDPTTRKLKLPCGEEILLTDTVGFIRKLPHHLVKAFKSTLDEVIYSDILIVLSDASDPECEGQLAVTKKQIEELGAADKPALYVFNKCDVVKGADLPIGGIERGDTVCISAKTGQGMEEFISKLEALITEGKGRAKLFFPLSEQSQFSRLYKLATVESAEYGEDGVTVIAHLDRKTRGIFERFCIE
ncbi:MAG: GTPase HflX [Clostridiales bacterium]|nr:GTPase HflX [Clostridiales bacterium]